MGNNNGITTINVNQLDLTYISGETIVGTINLHTNEKQIKIYEIRLDLIVKIRKNENKFKTIETKYLTIISRVNLLENPQYLQPVSFVRYFSHDIIFNKIDNPKRILFKNIQVTIHQLFEINEYKYQSELYWKNLTDFINCNDEQLQNTYSINIPTKFIHPTFEFRRNFNKNINIKISYILRFTSEYFVVDIPIVIGTEPAISNLMINSSALNNEQFMNIDNDLPPSYESIMLNNNNSFFH
ncbi:hypothetical protein I4U23_022813 [Adineta vaga]|nr:hypothetical protein I4U23_022813 [Adineta vaga]